ncbi:MAG: hypothetical protein NVSMB17_06920 [Candidatus Dormibacteria bacterium]
MRQKLGLMAMSGITLVLGACGSQPAASATSAPSAAAQPAGATANAVQIVTSAATVGAFSPAKASVKAGASLTWKNTTNDVHNVTFADGGIKSSADTMQQGDTFTTTFATPGTYKYHCTFHPGMDGQVEVTQ